MKQLFAVHDLNGNGLLEEAELIRLNEKIAVLHHGEDADTAEVRSTYQELFRTKLDSKGRAVPYEVFRGYAQEVMDGLDDDPEAQEMILEQFVAEAQCGRRALGISSDAAPGVEPSEVSSRGKMEGSTLKESNANVATSSGGSDSVSSSSSSSSSRTSSAKANDPDDGGFSTAPHAHTGQGPRVNFTVPRERSAMDAEDAGAVCFSWGAPADADRRGASAWSTVAPSRWSLSCIATSLCGAPLLSSPDSTPSPSAAIPSPAALPPQSSELAREVVDAVAETLRCDDESRPPIGPGAHVRECAGCGDRSINFREGPPTYCDASTVPPLPPARTCTPGAFAEALASASGEADGTADKLVAEQRNVFLKPGSAQGSLSSSQH